MPLVADVTMIGSPMVLLAALAQGPQLPAPPPVYVGRLGQLDVRTPRVEATVAVDGILDESAWAEAAVLTGFSQFTPVDGVAAVDSTEVLVWYSSTTLHIGIRAFDRSGAVRSTLSQRDRIFGDDNVQVFLSTFDDGRQATFLAVNPLGVQADGAVNESGRGGGCNGFNCAVSTREGPDLSQDFVWQSQGRLTEWGYEVEIAVPLKSIRFQSRDPQTWGVNVLRVVQRSGQEQSWTPARLGRSSFLGQSGRLTDLRGLRAGRAIDMIPEFTSRVSGAPASGDGAWDYAGGRPEVGGNLRWGVTPNLTLNATANPDFSQVESDAGQFAFDPRQAIFFPERRPFFLEGIEQFQVPNNLIHTRRIVQPVLATKVTGKAMGTRLGVLAAVDDRSVSLADEHPLFGVVRLQRDIGSGSQVGLVHTEQHDGEIVNRVTGIDGRLVFHRIHSVTFNGALSRDRAVADGPTTTSSLWGLAYRLNGRGLRARYTLGAIDDDFRTRTGFISRAGIANAVIAHSYTVLRPERLVESVTGEVVLNGTWKYDSLVGGGGIQDRKLHFNLNTQWRGGWNAGASLLVEDFGYDPDLYTRYGLLQSDGSVTPFVGTPRLPNLDYVLTLGSPALGWGSFNAFVLWGRDENFAEWASGDLLWINAGVTLTPTEQLRANLSLAYTKVNRPSDGSRVQLQMVPRARLEYQLTRSLQVRLISQYALETRDALRDDSRTHLPIVLRGGDGTFSRALALRDGQLRNDVLLTYLPNPGTVVYLGYGASHLEQVDPLPGEPRFRRGNDAFFLKVSYLFRMAG
jgi:hypothetical protein